MAANSTKKKKSESTEILKTWSLRARKPVNYSGELIRGLENSFFECKDCSEKFTCKTKLKQHCAQNHQGNNCAKCKIILENPLKFKNMTRCSECTVNNSKVKPAKQSRRSKTASKKSNTPISNGKGREATEINSLAVQKQSKVVEVIEIKDDDDDDVIEIIDDDNVVSSNVSSQNKTKEINGKCRSAPQFPIVCNGLIRKNVPEGEIRRNSASLGSLQLRSNKSSSDVSLVVREKQVTFEITTHESPFSVPPKLPMASRIIENVSRADSTLPIIQSVCSAGIVLQADTVSAPSVQASAAEQESLNEIDPVLSRILQNKEITVTPIL